MTAPCGVSPFTVFNHLGLACMLTWTARVSSADVMLIALICPLVRISVCAYVSAGARSSIKTSLFIYDLR
jgi:hypothetical protein